MVHILLQMTPVIPQKTYVGCFFSLLVINFPKK